MPADWQDVVGDLAYFFRFQPSELDAMTASDLEFWVKQGERINERLNDERSRNRPSLRR